MNTFLVQVTGHLSLLDKCMFDIDVKKKANAKCCDFVKMMRATANVGGFTCFLKDGAAQSNIFVLRVYIACYERS